ncbi:hypothetical protein [Dactylosporangium sp. NPDC051541]|uniref:hypothetical protein n=1 Tax=Dactylosporangium sp. NPDC051541 TaxID=3363977 RepID=UPI00379C693F
MDFSDPEIPAWFWLVIDAAGHRLDVLESWLMQQPKDVVVAYGQAYVVAAADLVEGYFADGVLVDAEVWSEDSTEDLCTWIVGQGRELWARVASGDLPLSDAAQIYLGRVPGSVPWAPDASGASIVKSPWRIEGTVYWNRFDEELLTVLNSNEILFGGPPDVEPDSLPSLP